MTAKGMTAFCGRSGAATGGPRSARPAAEVLEDAPHHGRIVDQRDHAHWTFAFLAYQWISFVDLAPPRKNRPPQPRQREHVLPVRHRREHVLLDPLAVRQHALLVAARAEVPGLARVGEQELVPAGVAVDARKPLVRVSWPKPPKRQRFTKPPDWPDFDVVVHAQ